MNTLCERLLSEKLNQGRKGTEDIATDRTPSGTLVNMFDIVIIEGTHAISRKPMLNALPTPTWTTTETWTSMTL